MNHELTKLHSSCLPLPFTAQVYCAQNIKSSVQISAHYQVKKNKKQKKECCQESVYRFNKSNTNPKRHTV